MEMSERDTIRTEKARLRTRFNMARRAVREADYAARSALIQKRLLALTEVAAARVIHVYWPLVARGEVDTRALIEVLHDRGVEVQLPVVASPAGAPPRLRSVPYEGEAALRLGRFGLREPVGADAVASPDVVIVPALGAGRNGHRIGHGAGFYDAFLGDTSAFTVCPVWASCLVPHVPAEPHDRLLDVVVTEDAVLRVG